MRRLVALAIGLAAALPALAAPPAGAALPVGEADGVRIVREKGALVVLFSQKARPLWRRIAGRRVAVFCTELAGADGVEAGGGPIFRAPKRGRRLMTGDLTRGMDYCRVWLVPRRHGRRLIVSVPLTQRGAVHLDEERRVQAMFVVSFLAERSAPPWPTAEELMRLRRRWPYPIVALAAPGDTPPPNTIGWYTHGRERVAIAIVSATGRRLYIETGPDGELHTNVAEHLFGDLD